MGMIDWNLGPGFMTRIFGFVDFFDLGAEAREGGAHSGGCSLLVAGRRRELGRQAALGYGRQGARRSCYAKDVDSASLYLIEDAVVADTYAPPGTRVARKFDGAVRAWIFRQLLEQRVKASGNVFWQPPKVSLNAMLQMDGVCHRVVQSLPSV